MDQVCHDWRKAAVTAHTGSTTPDKKIGCYLTDFGDVARYSRASFICGRRVWPEQHSERGSLRMSKVMHRKVRLRRPIAPPRALPRPIAVSIGLRRQTAASIAAVRKTSRSTLQFRMKSAGA